ncbi:Calx-beta domain-containing protein, partial [Aquimarina sp. MMG016]|uniref:beta strand repeat-containing protein n=1 Tax=Aquimarina sp. MMG016 TaxID=2822690 RepID=UPI001B39DBE2
MNRNTIYTILTTVMLLWIGNTSLFAQATVSDVAIIEGDSGTSNAVVTVTLPSAAPVGGTTVLYNITANTATEGTDYTVPGDRIVIPQGSSTGTISIPIIGDTTTEDLEDFSISVSTDLANDAGFDNAASFWSPLTGTNVCTPSVQIIIGTAYVFETNPETTYGGSDATNQVLEVDCQSQGFQNIPTVNGVTYTVTFKASRRTANGAGPNPSTVTVSALNAGTLAVDGTTTIQRTNTSFNLSESTFNFTASSASTRIEFTTANNQGLGMIFDDLSIVPQTPDDTATITIIDRIPGNVGANLTVWLKSNVDVLNGSSTAAADGEAVLQWNDQISGNELTNATAGQRPVFAENEMNFYPGVDFDGADDRLLDGSASYGTMGTGDREVFAVAKMGTTLDNFGAVVSFGRNTSQINRRAFVGIIGSDGTTASARHLYNDIPTSNYVHNHTSDPQTPTIYNYSNADGVTVANMEITVDGGTSTFASVSNGGQIPNITSGVEVMLGSGRGDDATPSAFYDGLVSEVLIYDRQLSASERQQVNSYLSLKYGITLNNGATAYLASDGTTQVWPVDVTYDSDIFGIANDAPSALDNQISKSINTGAVLTVSTDTNFTGANGTHVSLTNGQFLLVGNDGGDGAPASAINTDLVTTTYYERSAREWKAVNTGTIAGAANLQFDGYDDTWVLLTRTADGDFSATTGTAETALSATGTVALALPGTTFFTLARKATSIEFEVATANDVEATGGNLPNLLIDGTLLEDTNIDIVLNAAGTATLGTDYTFGGNTAALPQTIAVSIPAGTYTAASPLALAGLDLGKVNQFDESYPIIRNDAADGGSVISETETIIAPFTGTYEVTYSGKTFTSSAGGTANGFVLVGTTSGGAEIFTATGDRIDAATPLKKYTFSLTAGTQYFITSVGGGSSVIENVTTELNFLPGSVSFAITDEAIVEADETIDLSLSDAQPGLVIQEVTGGALIDTHVYTITNDDALTVEFNNATYTSTDETGVITLTLDVSGAEITSAGSIQVDVTGGTATGGGTDYTFTDPTTVTIPIGDYTTPGTVTTDITIVADAIVEGDETILLGLITPSTGVTVGTQATATATITDDDGLTVEFNNATYTSTNETGVITLTLDVSGAEITTAGSIQVDVTGGTATGGGTDYTFTDPTTVTIPIGDYTGGSTVTTDITIVTDAVIEGDETILLGLITPSTGVTVGTQATATATITDDDGLTVEFNNATYTSTNETGVITLTLDISGAEITTAGSIQVDVTGGTATGGGTDYTFTDPTTVTIPIGDYTTPGTVTTDITIITDAVIEGDETILLGLITPSTGVTVGTQATATATITDDDGLTVEFNNATYTSTNETGVITLTLDISGAEITTAGNIQVDVTGGTATGGGTDYTFTDPTTVTIPIADYTGGGTVTTDITIVTDALIEGDETILLGLITPSTGVTVGTQSTATATITDDDGLTVEFNNATYTSTNETGVITLTLDVSGAEITTAGSIQVNVTGGTA